MNIEWHDLILKPINLWNLPMLTKSYYDRWEGGKKVNTNETEYTNGKNKINPSHYRQGKVECIEALESATINLKGLDAVCTANAIKYMWRWKEKNGVEDLQKSLWYINKLIEKNNAT